MEGRTETSEVPFRYAFYNCRSPPWKCPPSPARPGIRSSRPLNGSEHAFRPLFEQERERPHRFVVKRVEVPGEAEDIVQEPFAGTYWQIGDFRGEAKISTGSFRLVVTLPAGLFGPPSATTTWSTRTKVDAERGGAQEAYEQAERKEIVHDAHQAFSEPLRERMEWSDES